MDKKIWKWQKESIKNTDEWINRNNEISVIEENDGIVILMRGNNFLLFPKLRPLNIWSF